MFLMLMLHGALGTAVAAPPAPGVSAALEQARTTTPQDKLAYGDTAVTDIDAWVKAIDVSLAAAQKTGDAQRVECLERRVTPMRVLLEVSRTARDALAGHVVRNDGLQGDREWRKIAVAHGKAGQLRQDAAACTGSADVNRSSSGPQASLNGSAEGLVDAPPETVVVDTPDASPN
ncbi:MAG: hypothetical protein RLZZ299_1166 [Pseudomonadota bacterium]|jgi:hypothetical protein